MKLAFVGTYDPEDIGNWSGTPHHMVEALRACQVQVVSVGPLTRAKRHEAKRYLYRGLGLGRYLPDREGSVLSDYGRQVEARVDGCDVVLSPGSIALTRVRSEARVVFWTDATVGQLMNYYPEFSGLSRRSRRSAHAQEREAIERADLCVYASDWAAASAVEDYGGDPAKVHVIPFGANVRDPGRERVETAIAARGAGRRELVLIQANWHRKGGDFAVEVARELGAHLSVVGAPPAQALPDHVTYRGYLRKSVEYERNELESLLLGAHFLILPTVADCTPIVFCEASAHGIPSVTFDTGGVRGAISERNGVIVPTSAAPDEMASAVNDAMPRYQELARSAREEYETRLNWDTAVSNLLSVIARQGL